MKKLAVLFVILAFLAAPAALFAQEVQEEAQEAGEAAEQAGEEAGEAAEQAGQEAQEAGEEAVQEAQEGAEEAGQQVQEGAEEAGEAAEQAGQEAEQAVEQATQQDQPPAGGMTVRRLDELAGTPIASQDGEVEGSIQDVVITSQGDLTHLVVEVAQAPAEGEAPAEQAPPAEEAPAEEAPPAGEAPAEPEGQAQTAVPAVDQYLVPFDSVTFGQPNQAATLDMGLQDLQAQPALQDGRLPAEISAAADQEQVRYLLGSEVEGYTFIGQDGEEIGEVEGIMLDLAQARVSYLALATGGFLGLGEKLITVPVDSITEWNLDEERLLTSLTNEQIDQAEGFDSGEWPQQPQQLQQPEQEQPQPQQQQQ